MPSKKVPLYFCYKSTNIGKRRIEGRPPLADPPLALGTTVSYSMLRPEVAEHFYVVPGVVNDESVLHELFKEHGDGVFLFSNYVWSARGNLVISDLVRKMSPRSLTVHGGPSTPKREGACAEFMAEHPSVDFAARGEGEMVLADLLSTLALPVAAGKRADHDALARVRGITFRAEDGALVRNEDGGRITNLDEIPSPYLNGLLDNANIDEWLLAVHESNRGCPYGCTFCDWGSATLQKIYKFSLDRVKEEIEWFASKKIASLINADANFGAFDRDVEIAELYAKVRRDRGYPKHLAVNYAKNATKRLAEIVRIMNEAGMATSGNIAIQTHDPQTLENIQRGNIKTERYDELLAIFRAQRLPVSSDLLLGLPGQTLTTFKRDLQFFIDRRVFASARIVTVLPNSPMADPAYREKFGIRTNKYNVVIATSSMPESDLAFVRDYNDVYIALVGFAMLKYYLLWLQLDEGIASTDWMEGFLRSTTSSPSDFPQTHRLVTEIMKDLLFSTPNRQRMLDEWDAAAWNRLVQEAIAYTSATYSIPDGSVPQALAKLQIALMPQKGREFPYRLEVAHDVAKYFAQLNGMANLGDANRPTIKPLSEFGPGELVVTDPGEHCNKVGVLDNPWRIPWELESELMLEEALAFANHAKTPEEKRSKVLPVLGAK